MLGGTAGPGGELVRELCRRGFAGRIIGISARELGNEELLAAGAHALCPKGRFHTIGDYLGVG